MTEQGKRLMDVQIKTSLANNTTDKVVIIYNAANTTFAQTALISKSDFNANISSNNFVANNAVVNTLNVTDFRSDPANSESLSITMGQIFVSNGYLYVATDTDYVKRVLLSDF